MIFDLPRRVRALATGVVSVACTIAMISAAGAADPEMLYEPATGNVLYALEPDRPWHPASITKIMTAYLAFEDVKAGRLTWDVDVPLSDYARGQPASRIGLRGGIKINLEQAVAGMILRSANDFAVAIAERVEGDEGSFVQRMNRTARRLGMTRTNFENPHGLPHPEQITTARDMAHLVTAMLKNFPNEAAVFASPSIRIHKGTFHNANDLLRTFEGADGMKTGFTCASGYNVVATATRNGHRLTAIVFGAANRNVRSKRAAELLEEGFAFLQQPSPPAAQSQTVPLATPTSRHEQARASLVGSPQPAAIGAAVTNVATGTTLENPSPVPLPLRAPRELRDARAAFTPISIADLPMSPAEMLAPHDAATDTRMRKCPGSGRSRPHRRPKVAKAATHNAAAKTAARKLHVDKSATNSHRISTGALASGQTRKPVARTVAPRTAKTANPSD